MKLKLALGVALLVGTSPAAHAATIVINHVLNPASVGQSITQELLASPAILSVGDTLDLTITFQGGVSISVDDELGIWPLLVTQSGPSDALGTTGTLEFLGASANLVSGPIPLNQVNSAVHVGSYYGSSLYRLDNAPITFTGVRQILTIDFGSVPTREYEFVSLYVDEQMSPAVPEPATWAMMIAGFGLAGGALRRQRVSGSFA